MDQRKGIELRPLNSSRLDYSKIPKLSDFFATRCQFCDKKTQNEDFLGCQNCFNFETLVINAPNGSTDNGTVSLKFFEN